MPRIDELKDRVDADDPNAFFQSFEESLLQNRAKLEAFLKLERQVGVLDEQAWADLKERAASYLHTRRPGRGWQPLFDALNEAKGFAYLQRLGCTNVRFIPRAAGRTPDLEGMLGGVRVLCEVKTLNISDEEASRRERTHQGRPMSTKVSVSVSEGLLRKVDSTFAAAVQQFDAHDPQRLARRIIFVVIHFDDWVGDCQAEYFAQMDQHLIQQPKWAAEVVICPATNLFARRFEMQSATMVEL